MTVIESNWKPYHVSAILLDALPPRELATFMRYHPPIGTQ